MFPSRFPCQWCPSLDPVAVSLATLTSTGSRWLLWNVDWSLESYHKLCCVVNVIPRVSTSTPKSRQWPPCGGKEMQGGNLHFLCQCCKTWSLCKWGSCDWKRDAITWAGVKFLECCLTWHGLVDNIKFWNTKFHCCAVCSLEDDNAFMNDYGFMNNSRGFHLLFKMINIEDTRETLIGSSIIHHSKSLGSLNEGPSHPSKASPLMGKRVCLPLSTAPFFKPQDHLVSLGSSIHQAEDWSRLPKILARP